MKTTIEQSDYRASFAADDNKLRLYVGRVPRDEYERLRAEGWTSTPKQDCDFVATWTPQRRDTALEYAGMIEDEDQSPAERAADRAERFSGYRDKHTTEATGRADTYDAGPIAHGYQSAARAERAANRHDRIAARACDAWSKAEYWTSRTAGVINHALYKSTPGVRMGRIKVLEADLRRYEASPEHYGEWIQHTQLRLAYENQMLESVGGMAAFIEMVPGGWVGSHQIRKVNKSHVTGRVVSVEVVGLSNGYTKESGYTQRENRPCPVLFNIERLKAEVYRPPTEADIEALKAAAPVKAECPLINPTDADAERLQALWNDRIKAKWDAKQARDKYAYTPEFKASAVVRITQAQYSAHSKGTYARTPAQGVKGGGELHDGYRDNGVSVCKVRRTNGESYMADRIIILTDKPQKPFPASVWEAATEPATTDKALCGCSNGLSYSVNG